MVSESRLAYTSTLELPSTVCETFYGTKNVEDKQEDGLEEEIFYVDIEDVENSELRNNDRSDTLKEVLPESHSSSRSSNKESSDSDSDSVSSYKETDSSSESIEPEPESEPEPDSNSEITQNQITNNDLTNSGSENIAGTDNSNEVNSESDTSLGTENSEGTHNKITIQNYGYESEAVLKSAACPELYEGFKILLLSTLITKACC